MEDHHHHLQSLSLMPLLSRVHCLDSVISDVEKKQEQRSIWSNATPKLAAAREAASLMDRIRSLEERLLQLSQEIDHASTKASSSSSIQTTLLRTTSSTSCAQFRTEFPATSYPTFHKTHQSRLPCHEYFQKPRAPRHRMKDPDNGMQQKQGKVEIVEKGGCFNQKKKKNKEKRSKLLGC